MRDTAGQGAEGSPGREQVQDAVLGRHNQRRILRWIRASVVPSHLICHLPPQEKPQHLKIGPQRPERVREGRWAVVFHKKNVRPKQDRSQEPARPSSQTGSRSTRQTRMCPRPSMCRRSATHGKAGPDVPQRSRAKILRMFDTSSYLPPLSTTLCHPAKVRQGAALWQGEANEGMCT